MAHTIIPHPTIPASIVNISSNIIPPVSGWPGLNRLPHAPRARALPIELHPVVDELSEPSPIDFYWVYIPLTWVGGQ